MPRGGGGGGASVRFESLHLFIGRPQRRRSSGEAVGTGYNVTRGGDQTTEQRAVCRDTTDESLIKFTEKRQRGV